MREYSLTPLPLPHALTAANFDGRKNGGTGLPVLVGSGHDYVQPLGETFGRTSLHSTAKAADLTDAVLDVQTHLTGRLTGHRAAEDEGVFQNGYEVAASRAGLSEQADVENLELSIADVLADGALSA
jgi:hypothetical protein